SSSRSRMASARSSSALRIGASLTCCRYRARPWLPLTSSITGSVCDMIVVPPVVRGVPFSTHHLRVPEYIKVPLYSSFLRCDISPPPPSKYAGWRYFQAISAHCYRDLRISEYFGRFDATVSSAGPYLSQEARNGDPRSEPADRPRPRHHAGQHAGVGEADPRHAQVGLQPPAERIGQHGMHGQGDSHGQD